MKKVYLYVSTYFPVPERPSDCTFVYDQAMEVKRARPDWDVVVVNPHYAHDYEYGGLKVYAFQQKAGGKWLCPPLYDFFNCRAFAAALRRAGIAPADIAVVHGHLVPNSAYLLWVKRRNPSAKAVLQFHDADPYGMLHGLGLFGLKKKIFFAYHRRLMRRMNLLVAIAENVAKVVREAPHQTVFTEYAPMREAMRELRAFRPLGAACPPIYVLHNGVNPAQFHPLAHTPDPDGRLVVGCVGHFRDWKDQITLLKAAALLKTRVPNLLVRLVGKGVLWETCRAYARENGVNAEFIPSIPHDDLIKFYASLDLFVLPSFFEGLGCVFMEAAACGVPFMTCRGQGMDDYIAPGDRDTWLCAAEDPRDLAEKIARFAATRPRQTLAAPLYFSDLIPDYLKALDALG